ncbi:MAG: branched-chain amino acid ABC transporter permease, partial [Parvibaculum sp.]
MDWIYFLQLTANGLTLGLIYALIAAGLALMFGVLEIVNFAHGEFLMVGAYAMAFVLPGLGLSYLPGVVVAMLAATAVGLVSYEIFLSRLERGEFERSILITMGLSIVILYGVQYAFSATPMMVQTQFGFGGVQVGDIRLAWTRVAAAVLAVLSFILLFVVLNHTQLGRSMRAVAQNREAALMVGLKPVRVARNAVVLATALCGIA